MSVGGTASSHAKPRLAVRVARTVALAVLVGWLLYTFLSWVLVWNPADAGAYYDAATRLVTGGALYAPMNPEAHEVYRYAPWFAYAWIPLTALPRTFVIHAWSLAMLGCSLAAVWPLLRKPSWTSVALAVLLGQTLVETAMFGNAHPLVVALLVWASSRSSFPVAVGIASSLKLIPLAYVLVWLGRRDWRPAITAIAVAAVLFAPMLLFDLSSYPLDPGTGLLSIYAASPVLWLTLSLATAALTIWLAIRRSPYAWIAASVFMFVGPPRVATSYLAFLTVGYQLAAREMAASAARSPHQP
ncbi:MAG TPA: glycosyltransferase 87 family protein [Candidatus Limnocylindria bacterium]